VVTQLQKMQLGGASTGGGGGSRLRRERTRAGRGPRAARPGR
jgi:hypothetical protein